MEALKESRTVCKLMVIGEYSNVKEQRSLPDCEKTNINKNDFM